MKQMVLSQGIKVKKVKENYYGPVKKLLEQRNKLKLYCYVSAITHYGKW